MNGILIIDKEQGYTSRDVVNKVGKILGTKKIGHTGTLDPLATGVLVLCIGNATKLVEILTNHDKEYIAEITLGLLTDTLDITGNILKEEAVSISKEEVNNVLSNMIGRQIQEVPIYSAVKINGKKLYEYARNNEEVVLPKREIEIKEIELISDIENTNNKSKFSIRCVVSKGTYIRSLANDIALKLNTIGIMSNLRRTRQGNFEIDSAYKISDIENNNFKLININDVLIDYKKIIVDKELEKDILNGKIIKNIYDTNEVLFVSKDNQILALYHTYDKDINLIKPWKMF